MIAERVLYFPYSSMIAGPFKYIESGILRGLEQVGCSIECWRGGDLSEFRNLLDSYAPTLILGYLRGGSSVKYECMPVFRGEFLEVIISYRKTSNAKIAVYTHPDSTALRSMLNLSIDPDDISGAYQYYHARVPPLVEEQELVEREAIDIVLHTFSKSVGRNCFDWWHSVGLPVVEMPLAADDTIYFPTQTHSIDAMDICFIGGWWPFKGLQMDRFLKPAVKAWGDRMKIYGRNWPYAGLGELSDADFNGTVCSAAINLCFHEPSQVQGHALHVNERVFKLGACGAFFLCDENPCLNEYFSDAVVTFSDPDDFFDKIDYYIKNPEARISVATRCRELVSERHTYKARANQLLSALRGNV